MGGRSLRARNDWQLACTCVRATVLGPLLVCSCLCRCDRGAGIKLSDYTDVLAERLHLGAALGGVILLSIATNLPEIAITVAAALSGNVGVAVGNLLGGIAIQTVVLVALDAFGVRGRRPLTFMAASLTLVLEAALVVAVLLVVLAGSQLPAQPDLDRLTPGPVLIAVIWVAGLKLIGGPGSRLPWADSGEAPGEAGEARADTPARRPSHEPPSAGSAPGVSSPSSASPRCSPWSPV